MSADLNLEAIDRLGPALVALGHQRVSLCVDQLADGRTYYFVDGRNAEGAYFAGMGETPSQALRVADAFAADRASGGIHIHA